MKVYVILESFTDCKGGNSTSFGMFPTKEEAVNALPNAVVERLGFESIEDFEKNYGECFENFMGLNRESWTWDRDDDVIEFYIQEDDLNITDYNDALSKIKKDMLDDIKNILKNGHTISIDFSECIIEDRAVIITGTCYKDCFTIDELIFDTFSDTIECVCSSIERKATLSEDALTLDAVASILDAVKKER